jgi:hypothetical protein
VAWRTCKVASRVDPGRAVTYLSGSTESGGGVRVERIGGRVVANGGRTAASPRRRRGALVARLGLAPVLAAAAVLSLAAQRAPGGIGREAVGVDDALGVARTSSANLQAALVTNGRCGAFSDTVGTLVAENDFNPTARSLPRRVCLRNAGRESGRVSLRVSGLTDVDIACSPEEAAVDATCGRNAAGELGASVVQLYGIDRGCTNAAVTERSTSMPAMTSAPLLLAPELRAGEVMCVALRIEHAPGSERAALAAQSDRVGWSYIFELSDS